MFSSVSKKAELQRAPTTLIPEERPPRRSQIPDQRRPRRSIVKNQCFNVAFFMVDGYINLPDERRPRRSQIPDERHPCRSLFTQLFY